MFFNHATLFALCAAAFFSAATPASAREFEFQFAEAELATQEGAESVYDRLIDFSGDLCEYQFARPYAAASSHRFERCMRRTLKQMTRQIAHAKLHEIHEAEGEGTAKRGQSAFARRSGSQ